MAGADALRPRKYGGAGYHEVNRAQIENEIDARKLPYETSLEPPNLDPSPAKEIPLHSTPTITHTSPNITISSIRPADESLPVSPLPARSVLSVSSILSNTSLTKREHSLRRSSIFDEITIADRIKSLSREDLISLVIDLLGPTPSQSRLSPEIRRYVEDKIIELSPNFFKERLGQSHRGLESRSIDWNEEFQTLQVLICSRLLSDLIMQLLGIGR